MAHARWYGFVTGVLALVGMAASPVRAQVCDQTALFPRPIPLGISGGNNNAFEKKGTTHECFGGTLGSLTQDSSGNQYILSNNHVMGHLSGANPKPGKRIVQPGLIDNGTCSKTAANTVAYLSKVVKISFSRSKLNTVDAAIALVTPGDVESDGGIKNIGTISSSTVSSPLGLDVQKMGRTSCLTFGQVAAVGVNISVDYDDLRPGTKVGNFTDQIEIDSGGFASPGDSGSLIVTQDTCPRAVGLLFAGGGGSTFANPINDVLSALNVSMVGACSDLRTGNAMLTDEARAPVEEIAALVRNLKTTRDAHNAELMAIPGALGSGVGLGADHSGEIVVYVVALTPDVQAAAPTAVDGVPVTLRETGVVSAY